MPAQPRDLWSMFVTWTVRTRGVWHDLNWLSLRVGRSQATEPVGRLASGTCGCGRPQAIVVSECDGSPCLCLVLASGDSLRSVTVSRDKPGVSKEKVWTLEFLRNAMPAPGSHTDAKLRGCQ